MGRWVSLAIATLILLSGPVHAQQSNPEQSTGVPLEQTGAPSPAQPVTPGSLLQQTQQQQSAGANPTLYHELDLLRHDGFAAATSATVSLRVLDHGGVTPPGLEASDFTLIVNGRPRAFRLLAPGTQATVAPPMVLLVFPPNDPVVHNIGVRQAVAYFSQQTVEKLPWRVGIFDSNGTMTPFTNGRSQLLAYLDEVANTKEPFQYASDFTPWSLRCDGPWLTEAQLAISAMQRYEGPKVILAMNPISGSIYGRNDQVLEHCGPEFLTGVAQRVGAHIYIGNVGGPDVIVPGGDAAEDQPGQINGVPITGGGPQLGTVPSYHMQIDPSMTAALSNSAYRTSQMMETAAATYGGFANSLNDLARQIHRDLDGGYALDFDMTPEDQDHGVPDVTVRLARRDLRVAILDVTPVGVSSDIERSMDQTRITALLKKAASTPIASPLFRITQHVDYFPLRDGLEPVLPMSAVAEWIGHGRGPMIISIAERVEDVALAHAILERELRVHWDGRSLSWERDGQLSPGHYLWSIAVHDGQGNIYAFSQKKIDIGFPRPGIAVSSLILGKACRADAQPTSGLQRRPPPGTPEQPHFQIDPMQAGDCRVRPDTLGSFYSTDTMHAFVRLYPTEKLDKGKPESWTAKFVLRSSSGVVEMEREIPFTLDSGSGYLASVQMPLNAPDISPGPHTVDVEMRGPGLRSGLRESRPVSILAPIAPER
ncbi:MAG TPA: hypothetical protein VMD92_05170 [Acidobacteriaceae bacterium]|nr:hypothetical protein [Acidobacteriaceae bacterium]